MRDMTNKQFLAACQRRGFRFQGFMGYVTVARGVSVSILNAGPNRRAQLAYLIQNAERIEKEFQAKTH